MTTTTTQDLTPGQYVKLASQPGLIGRFVRYYQPLASGTRNVQIDWNDPQLSLTVTENQITAI